MIKHEWRTDLSSAEAAEVADLLSRAAQFDAEPEYTTIRIEDVLESMQQSDARVHHLLIWLLPYATGFDQQDRPEQIAGLLRMVVDTDGSAEAWLVIDPKFRSIGITTLLIERVGLDTSNPDGWLSTGARQISSWAQGNHPAAGRLSDRFLIARTRRIWKLIQPVGQTSDEDTAADRLEPISAAETRELSWAASVGATPSHALRDGDQIAALVKIRFDPIESEEFGSCATISSYRVAPNAAGTVRRSLLSAAAHLARQQGLTGVIIYVDSDDREWVNSCRLNGFQHDRTDVRFQLGDHQ